MKARPASKFFSAEALVLYLAGAKLLFHLLIANRYGISRDELYYLACGEHLDWGYVDLPPMIAVVAWIAHHIFGDWLVGLRFFPAVAGGVTVWLPGTLTRELGGRAFAQVLAALAATCVPIYFIMHHWLTMNAFEPLLWLACILCIVRAINRNEPRYWIWFGFFAGLAMQTKYTIAFFVFALVIGMVMTCQHRFLVRKEFWIGAAIAFLFFLPNLIWLVRHDFPFLEFMHNNQQARVFHGPIRFILDQAQMLNPILFPLWLGGLIWLFFGRESRRFRLFAIIYVVLLATFIALRGKNYYLASIYPILFAAGAVAFEKITATRLKASRVVYVVLIIGWIIIRAPAILPIFSPEGLVAYRKILGQSGQLPYYLADEFGWEEMARETARVYKSLSLEEQTRTAIFARNYGEAGAIDFFGPRLGLPKAISSHLSYWLWGPRDYDGSTVIVLGGGESDLREGFQTVEIAGRVGGPYSLPGEHFDIFLCRGLTENLHQFWRQMKKYVMVPR